MGYFGIFLKDGSGWLPHFSKRKWVVVGSCWVFLDDRGSLWVVVGFLRLVVGGYGSVYNFLRW